jgi:16S rRNA (guanine527-N7)-methyltransferase
MNKEEFIKNVEALGIVITDENLSKLEEYYELLTVWNKKINLTAIVKKEDVYLKHFYDSLTLFKAIDLNKTETLCDAGSGAGFPGLVLKIFFPKLNIVLVDALQKRVTFLNEVIEKLHLKNIIAVHSRIEDYAKENREIFDVVTCRAVSKLNIMSELCMPLVKVNGYFIPMKGTTEELNDIKFLNYLDSRVLNVFEFYLPIENSKRSLIKIQKTKNTNHKFPRNFNIIKLKPL